MASIDAQRRPRLHTRPPVSCLQCRSRKVRCDRQKQCANCLRRGEQCVWPTRVSRRSQEQRGDDGGIARHESSNTTSHPHAQGIEARLEGLERAIHDLRRGAHVTSSTPTATQPIGVQSSPMTTLSTPSEVHAARGHRGERESSLGLEMQIMDEFDHQIISSRHVEKRRYSPVRSTVREHALTAGASTRTFGESVQVGQKFARLWVKLPPHEHVDWLLRRYWVNVEWIHHVLHRASFDQWLERMRAAMHSSASAHTAPLIYDDLHTLGLLFCMLCLSIHFAGKTSNEDRWFAERFHSLSCKALDTGEYLDHHSVASIQTLIMQGLWLNDHGKSERHHANLAIAIRMANGLGMVRQDADLLDAETRLEKSTFSSQMTDVRRHFNAIEEVARRIYWSLICQDSYTASSCNFTYLIQPKHIHIAQPLNLNDEELDEAHYERYRAHEDFLDRATEMSYHIVKIPFALLTRHSVDLFGPASLRERFADSVQLEAAMQDTYSRLPRSQMFDYDQELERLERHGLGETSEQILRWQRLFLKIGIHNRVMRIYRPFVIRGYRDDAYTHATKAALTAATSLLHLLTFGMRIKFPGRHWWVVRIHVFTAGILCCIALYHSRLLRSEHVRDDLLPNQQGDFSMEQLSDYVQFALDLLSDGKESSEAARHAVDVLQTLYRQARGTSTLDTTGTTVFQEADTNRSSTVRAAGEQSPLIPTIDWSNLLGPTTEMRFMLNDQALLDAIDAFGPDVWQS